MNIVVFVSLAFSAISLIIAALCYVSCLECRKDQENFYSRVMAGISGPVSTFIEMYEKRTQQQINDCERRLLRDMQERITKEIADVRRGLREERNGS